MKKQTKSRVIAFVLIVAMLMSALSSAAMAAPAKQKITEIFADYVVTSYKDSEISYKLSREADVKIEIFNTSSKLVASYTVKNVPSAKKTTFNWRGKTTKNNQIKLPVYATVPEGKYYAKLTSQGVWAKSAVFDVYRRDAKASQISTRDYIKNLQNAYVKFKLNKSCPVSFEIYNQKGFLVASAERTVTKDVLNTFGWNGKATKGNTAGLKPGAYAPIDAYTLKVSAFGVDVVEKSIKVGTPFNFGGKKITSSLVTGKTKATAQVYPNNNVKAEMYIFREDKKWVAKQTLSLVKGKLNPMTWDGKVTNGNTAGLTGGIYAPPEKYICVVRAGGLKKFGGYVTLKPDAKVTKGRISNFIKDLQSASIGLKTNLTDTIEVKLMDATGKIFAVLDGGQFEPYKEKAIQWDGKATLGNTAGLPEGAYIPIGKYNIFVTVGKGGGSVSGVIGTILVQEPLKIESVELDSEITLSESNAVLEFTTNHSTKAEMKVYDSTGKRVAALELDAKAKEKNGIVWKGHATSDNNAGIKPGEFVPKGVYTATITVGGISQTAGKITVKEHSVIRNIAAKDYVRYMQEGEISIETNIAANLTLKLLDADNKIYAILAVGQIPAFKSTKVKWDGRVTKGNTVGLKEGAFAPAEGYTIVVTLGEGETAKNFVTSAIMRVLQPLEVTDVKVAEEELVLSKGKVNVNFKINHKTDVFLDLYRADGKRVATLKQGGTDSALNTIAWDGNATEENEAGLKKGEAVAVGDYTIKIRAGDVQLTAGKVTVKLSSEIRSVKVVDYIKDLQNASLTIEANAKDQATIKLMDTQNKVYAVLNAGVLTAFAPKEIEWDGKATVDNTAGLKAGVYVPVGKYSIVVTLGNGSTARTFVTSYTISVLPPLTLTDVKVNEDEMILLRTKVGVSFKVNHKTTAFADYYRADGKRVATLKYNAVDTAGNTISWDGTATDSNEAGLKAGESVAQGEYTIKVRVGNLETTAGKVVVKPFFRSTKHRECGLHTRASKRKHYT